MIAEHVEMHEGFPFLRWRDVYAWTDALPEADRPRAWGALELLWNQHLARALGPSYRANHADGVIVVSSLQEREAKATLEFMQKTQQRILRTLQGLARPAEYGSEVLIVLDDEESYYRYISRFYPDAGEFSASGGMKIDDDGAVYYVTMKGHLRDVEPVVVHEMTHGMVSHLALPLWLDEGIAVNVEHRIAGGGWARYTPAEMRAKHLAFWDASTVQQFWSGRSWDTPGDANMLSYDLARILIEHLGADWPRFTAFVNAAVREDAGAEAAREHLGTSLGALVAALLEKDAATDFEPRLPLRRQPEGQD